MMSLSSIFLPSGVNFESKASVYDLICCQTTAVETKPLVSTSGASPSHNDTKKSMHQAGNPHHKSSLLHRGSPWEIFEYYWVWKGMQGKIRRGKKWEPLFSLSPSRHSPETAVFSLSPVVQPTHETFTVRAVQKRPLWRKEP